MALPPGTPNLFIHTGRKGLRSSPSITSGRSTPVHSHDFSYDSKETTDPDSDTSNRSPGSSHSTRSSSAGVLELPENPSNAQVWETVLSEGTHTLDQLITDYLNVMEIPLIFCNNETQRPCVNVTNPDLDLTVTNTPSCACSSPSNADFFCRYLPTRLRIEYPNIPDYFTFPGWLAPNSQGDTPPPAQRQQNKSPTTPTTSPTERLTHSFQNHVVTLASIASLSSPRVSTPKPGQGPPEDLISTATPIHSATGLYPKVLIKSPPPPPEDARHPSSPLSVNSQATTQSSQAPLSTGKETDSNPLEQKILTQNPLVLFFPKNAKHIFGNLRMAQESLWQDWKGRAKFTYERKPLFHIIPETPKDREVLLAIKIVAGRSFELVACPSIRPSRYLAVVPFWFHDNDIKTAFPGAYSLHRGRKPNPNEPGKTIPTGSLQFSFDGELDITKKFHVGPNSFTLFKVAPELVDCWKCHRLGHHGKECRYPARCGKCAGPHFTRVCQLPREAPKKCCRCGRVGHTTYAGHICPVMLGAQAKYNPRNARARELSTQGEVGQGDSRGVPQHQHTSGAPPRLTSDQFPALSPSSPNPGPNPTRTPTSNPNPKDTPTTNPNPHPNSTNTLNPTRPQVAESNNNQLTTLQTKMRNQENHIKLLNTHINHLYNTIDNIKKSMTVQHHPKAAIPQNNKRIIQPLMTLQVAPPVRHNALTEQPRPVPVEQAMPLLPIAPPTTTPLTLIPPVNVQEAQLDNFGQFLNAMSDIVNAFRPQQNP